jgi:hypothetical protein
MKTLKELLLERHRDVEPKLDVVRKRALAALERPDVAQTWRDFLFSLRWHLAGLSAVWLVVLVLTTDSHFNSVTVAAQEKIPSAPVLRAELMEKRRELIELTQAPQDMEPTALPPRRSEIAVRVEVV